MLRLLLMWIVCAGALLLVAYLYPGVKVASFGTAMIAALVLGLVNAIIRPILVILTLPVTILTLGLFIFVINALLFWFVAELLPGFEVGTFIQALIGSLLYSFITLIASMIIGSGKK